MRRTVISTCAGLALAAAGLAVPSTPAAGDEPPPPNDDFSNATAIPVYGGTVTGTNVGSGAQDGEPNHGHSQWNEAFHSVWWSWTPTASGETTISTCDSSFDTRLGVYTGSAVDQLKDVAWNEDGNDPSCARPEFAVATFEATAGTTYFIAVDTSGQFGSADPRGPITLTIAPPPGDEEPPAPPNDDFGDAVTLEASGGTVTGDNDGATAQTGEPNHAGSVLGAAAYSVWYDWTAPATGETTVSTCSSSFDTRLGVYTGTAVDALTEVASNEDGNDTSCANPKLAVVTFPAEEGTTYHIAVDSSGVLASGGQPLGLVSLELAAPDATPPPTSDHTNPGTVATEEPVTFTMPRLMPRCPGVRSNSGDDCPIKTKSFKFFSVEKNQHVSHRIGVVRRLVERLQAQGADIVFASHGVPSVVVDGNLRTFLRTRGTGGEVLAQRPSPGEQVTITSGHPLYIKVDYFDPAEDQKILDATMDKLEKKGEDRKNVKSPCDFIASNASFNAIERKLGQVLGAGTLTQKRAGQILKGFGCHYWVEKYVDGFGLRSDTVLDVVAVDKKTDAIGLKLALPVAQDFALVIREDPTWAETGVLGLGLDGKLTASRTQLNRFTVQVLERSTGRLVPGVKLDFFDSSGKPDTMATVSNGERTFTSLLTDEGRLALKATYRDKHGVKMVGYRQIDVVKRKSSFVTMSGRTMTWNGSSYTGTQADLDRAQQLDIVPGNMGTGLTGPATEPPKVRQITAAFPSGQSFVAGQHNAVYLPNDSNYLVGAAPGLVTIGGGWQSQVASRQPLAARSWANPFQQAADWLGGILTGLQQAFSSGTGTVAQKTSATEKQMVTDSIQTLLDNGAHPTGSGSISQQGLGVIASGGGNVIASGGGNVIASGALNLIGQAGGNVIASGGGNVIASGALNRPMHGRAATGLSIGDGNVISLEKDMMPAYGGNVIAAP